MAHVAHLFIGHPENHAPQGETPWITAIFRKEVAEPAFLTRTGFHGDQVANVRVHGGPDKAALLYAISHYPAWRQELGLPMQPGGFGENLGIDGLDENTVCIGDSYRIGDAEVQVSQPRGPCATLARRWELPELVKMVRENHRSGWYVRILREGNIAPEDTLELAKRPHPQWTIARTAQVNYSRTRDLGDLRELIALPELSNNWRSDLQKKFAAAVGA